MNITLAQLNYQIGDFEGNFKKITDCISHNHQNSDLIVFSELCLCGYYPHDLLERPDFIQVHDSYLNKVLDLTRNLDCAIILGVITQNIGPGKPLHNSLVIIQQGKIIYTYHKKLLPVYNIFDEARHFEPGKLEDNDSIFIFKNFTLGFLICEDGWATQDNLNYPIDPSNRFSEKPLDCIIAINGSPSNLGKQPDRIEVFSKIAIKSQTPLLFCNQVGGNDDIVFDGGSFILNNAGEPIANLPYFQPCTGQVHLDPSTHALTYVKSFEKFYYLDNIKLIYQQILLGLKDYAQKCHFKGVVIGLSGGIDSALTLTLAVQALGSENVKAIFMPTRFTSVQSQQDSELICQNLNVELFHVNIDKEFEFCLNQFKQAFHQESNKITKQNIQARIRGRILMEYSNQTGYLVLSTGNKSELSCGYTTLYGDMTGGLNLIGDLYKTDVYQLADFINRISNAAMPIIPFSIIQRAPTAELDYNQKDSDDLLPYHELDAILKLYIEGDLLSLAEQHDLEKITDSISQELIFKIHKMVDKAEFKRRQSAPIIRVQKRAFGYGRRLPISMFIR
jgi:NAD+ synthase (glutamine-hydrolysing)